MVLQPKSPLTTGGKPLHQQIQVCVTWPVPAAPAGSRLQDPGGPGVLHERPLRPPAEQPGSPATQPGPAQ